MYLKSFQEINSWQKARELSIQIYKEFSNLKDFGFRDQITRASVSIMNNIAEGYGRSNNKEFLRFLSYSKASTIEVQSMLILSQDLSYLTSEKFNQLYNLSEETLNLIGGFINYLKNHSSTNQNQKTDHQTIK